MTADLSTLEMATFRRLETGLFGCKVRYVGKDKFHQTIDTTGRLRASRTCEVWASQQPPSVDARERAVHPNKKRSVDRSPPLKLEDRDPVLSLRYSRFIVGL
jgi:hypothetical protein